VFAKAESENGETDVETFEDSFAVDVKPLT